MLKKATTTDIPTIQSLAHRTWPDTFGDILSPDQIDYMLEMMYSPAAIREQMEKGHVFHLVYEAGQPQGYLSHQLDYLPGTTKVHKIYVLPEQQGKGLGKLLIRAAERFAKEAGQQTLRLDVNYQNQAIGFYEYLGFVKIGRHNTDIGNGYLMEDFIMEAKL
ncbi:GNAT family N-acetyltransferase [Lewinellaceae bacterium SD302]|nr:GNAT family N-acetyltransferase [Lewinellaceae bacterium SD302]